MKRFVIDDTTQTILNVISVDPDNLPAMPEGQSLSETGGNIGDVWNGTEWAAPVIPVTAADVQTERDRRLAADFEFQGKLYQRDAVSLSRITGAATLAGFAIASGSPVGNLRWANPDQDFGWIASDNTVTPMDAQTAFAFGQAAAAVETAIVFASKALREMDPIPDNYTDDIWWG